MTDFANLTPRELQVAGMLAIGSSCADIAADLGIAIATVYTHRENLLWKLELRNTAQLARLAILHGVVSMHDDPSEGHIR